MMYRYDFPWPFRVSGVARVLCLLLPKIFLCSEPSENIRTGPETLRVVLASNDVMLMLPCESSSVIDTTVIGCSINNTFSSMNTTVNVMDTTDRSITSADSSKQPFNTTVTSRTLFTSEKEQTLTTNSYDPNQNTHYNSFPIFADDCRRGVPLHFFGTRVKSVIWGIIWGQENSSNTFITCKWSVSVSDMFLVSFTIDFLTNPCLDSFNISISEKQILPSCLSNSFSCTTLKSGIVFTRTSRVDFLLQGMFNTLLNKTVFRIHFWATTDAMRNTLPVTYITPLSGIITSPEFDGTSFYQCGIRATNSLTVPPNTVVMISFANFHLSFYGLSQQYTEDFLEMSHMHANRSVSLIRRLYGNSTFKTSSIHDTSLYFQLVTNYKYGKGFKALFSFHSRLETPVKLMNGLFNCSMPLYITFKQHLECNLEKECQNVEDEGPHCPFSSNECNGKVAVQNKCYMFVSKPNLISWIQAEEECQRGGGTLATMKTRLEWEAVLKLYELGKYVQPAFVGLTGYRKRMPNIYRDVYRRTDGTIAYDVNTVIRNYLSVIYDRMICALYDFKSFESLLTPIYCDLAFLHSFICQSEIAIADIGLVIFPRLKDKQRALRRTDLSLLQCPGEHVTHTFLSCDPECSCRSQTHSLSCTVHHVDGNWGPSIVDQFPCNDGIQTIPYTLVCDFKQDCPDGSDEEFCIHNDICQGFKCRNGQCIDIVDYCNALINCWDGSDESCDQPYRWETSSVYRRPPPAIIYFDGKGNFIQEAIGESQPCPETHFRCPDGYCLPVYVFCNGVYDCSGHEDEVDCHTYACPGFYRCRESSVCVHSDHLCDGWPQCPQHDDELYCGLQCPLGCDCQGLAFVCKVVFNSSYYSAVKYMDASGSGISPLDLKANVNLVFLKLAFCGIKEVDMMEFPNLQHLDLSNNLITFLNTDALMHLVNLKLIRISRNPLAFLYKSTALFNQHRLEEVDLSFTNLNTFDSEPLYNFRNIHILNISHSQVDIISSAGMKSMGNLMAVDIRGNEVKQFPSTVFRGLSLLKRIYSDNYRLCCKETLPLHFDGQFCWAPRDEISSCEDLLRSDLYRAFLWIFSTLSTVENAGCLIVRLFCTKYTSATGYNVFVTNLSIADFFMGFYLVIIGVADSMYRGQYLWYEHVWKSSIACHTAGFIALFSSELSAFIIFLITLDRLIVLQFPFTRFQFQRRSAIVTCSMAWMISFLIAVVPLLPMTSHWNFYSHNGICLPLPVTRKMFNGRNYSYGVMVGLNSILFSLIAIGQVFIFFSIRSNTMTTDTTKKSQDKIIARRLITVVVSDFLCWFPIGLLGIMTASGTAVSSEVNIIIVIFVLPLNSVLNPYLYTFNMLMEKKRKAREIALFKQLGSQMESQETVTEVFTSSPVPRAIQG